jgi:release factor glutamine methyltransferase
MSGMGDAWFPDPKRLNIRDLRNWALSELSTKKLQAGTGEELVDFLLAGYLGYKTYGDLRINLDRKAMPDLLEKWPEFIAEVIKGKPVQYILGHSPFFESEFFVTSDTLIPRQETEELVAWVLEDNSGDSELNVLDLGTGTGAIGISLAKRQLKWKITLSDVSAEALKITRKNVINNNVNVVILQSDMFSEVSGKFDLIISNPPYIAENQIDTMDDSVIKYEPHSALFADDNGLYFYREIEKNLPLYLNENGFLYIEFGYEQANAIRSIFENWNVEIRKDILGKDRMGKITWKQKN